MTNEQRETIDKFDVKVYNEAGTLIETFNYIPMITALPQDVLIRVVVTPK